MKNYINYITANSDVELVERMAKIVAEFLVEFDSLIVDAYVLSKSFKNFTICTALCFDDNTSHFMYMDFTIGTYAEKAGTCNLEQFIQSIPDDNGDEMIAISMNDLHTAVKSHYYDKLDQYQ